MKEIKINIKIDESSGKFGCIVDKDKDFEDNMFFSLALIGIFDFLKSIEQKKINVKQNFRGEYFRRDDEDN